MEMKKVGKGEIGITLIVLVVTVIVLLILAGVTISLVLGNNGLFKRASDAANIWKKAEANEQNEMKKIEDAYDKIINDLEINEVEKNPSKPITEITGKEKINIETKDKEGNRVVVPAGFKVVNPESTVNEGIVIEDVSANNSDTVGNQFVWIPCEIETEENKNNGKLKYDRYAFTREEPIWDYKQTKLDEKDADGSYKINIAKYGEDYFHEEMSSKEMISIQKYGGYYIGRYEVGCETKRTSHTAITEVGKVKKGLNVYNYLTRNEAITVTEKIYEGKSKLCSSYAWDTALKFIDGETGTYGVNSIGDNCKASNLENTGYHKEKNIYDMGGNIAEWTTETSTFARVPYVSRGGNFDVTALDVPAGDRAYGNVGGYHIYFRSKSYFIYVKY